jgi:hypothetical protein
MPQTRMVVFYLAVASALQFIPFYAGSEELRGLYPR